MSAIEVKVPDIGDYKNVPIIEVHVKPGDDVKREDPLITLESDKAAMEVPAPREGKVAEVLVKVGDKVSEGSAILRLADDEARPEPADAKEARSEDQRAATRKPEPSAPSREAETPAEPTADAGAREAPAQRVPLPLGMYFQ